MQEHELTTLASGDLVTAAADLGRRDTERKLAPYALDENTALAVTRLRSDEIVAVTSLEPYLGAPLAPRGTVTLHDWQHFAEYVNRLTAADHTTVWALPDRGRVTAVFDDHADCDAAGWRSHTAVLQLQPDPDWTEWLKLNRQMVGQATFAEHLEGLAHTVVEPDAATMLEIATTFDAKRSVNFRSGTRLDSGDVELTYEETTKAKAGQSGKVEIPASFMVRVSPYVGMDAVHLTARFRYRITEGELVLGYSLLRPDRALRDGMERLTAQISEQIEPPVFLGEAPQPVRR
jgi:uncharacterized protein YfdQ (DUF2303 family)